MRIIQIITPEECRVARAWLNWSIKDLAHKLDMSPNTVVNFEVGRAQSISASNAIVEVFNKEGIFFEENEKETIIRFVKK